MEVKKSKKIYKVVMLILVTSLVTFLITSIIMLKTGNISPKSLGVGNTSTSDGTATENNISNILKQFKTILSQKYIGDVDEQSMIEGAIKGYIEGIGDPYTEYFTKEEMSEFMEEIDSKYVGIGVYVANNTEDDTILVAGVMKGSPALDAGMQSGDIIKKIEGKEFKGSELSNATTELKGEEGTKVKVTVLREDKEIELEITRKTITVEHVASKVVSDNIGYIQVDSFDDGVAKSFETKVKELQEKNIKGLIIDLRSNGGGVVSEATDIADLFVNSGETLLITKDKNSKETETKSKTEQTIKDISVVVLVNSSTASASEILTAELKELYGATVIGNKTYGKGVIQTLYSLTDGSGIKITTEEYFTPKHNSINKVGIVPDIEVNLTKDANGKYEIEESKDAQFLKAIETIKNKQ